MPWKPFAKRAHAAAASDDKKTDEEGTTLLDDEAETAEEGEEQEAEQIAALRSENEQLRTDLAAATTERDELKASNEQLTTDLAAARESAASQQVSALEQAQDAAHAAAVRAFGQGSAALEQAEADIAQCESVREANALERAYKSAEPKGLSAPVRQTAAQKAQTTGRTSAKAGDNDAEDRQRVASLTTGAF